MTTESLDKIGVRLYECEGLRFYTRPGTTDRQAVDEVIARHVYLRKDLVTLDPLDRWLDLGGNIGAFAMAAAHAGGEVRTFEPEPVNAQLLRANVQLNRLGFQITVTQAAVVHAGAPKQPLFLCNGAHNRYRHTLQPKKNQNAVLVNCVTLASLLADQWANAIKLDIEGAELDMLSANYAWAGINKMVFEYHFDYDRLIPHFHARMDNLRNAGFSVEHAKMPDRLSYDFYPAATIVHAVRSA